MSKLGENNIILDAPEKPSSQKGYKILGYCSIGILVGALIAKTAHYNYWEYMLITGMFGMTIRSILLFIQKPQPIFAWFYFLGRVSLLVAAALYFGRFSYNSKIFYPPMALFLIGIIAVMIGGKKADDAEVDDL